MFWLLAGRALIPHAKSPLLQALGHWSTGINRRWRVPIEMIRAPSASYFPVPRKNDTPGQRQLSISAGEATKVSGTESGAAPESSV